MLYLILFFMLSFGFNASGAEPWLAFGDLRGHFEPCGCDPATDLGGLPRLDAYLARERMEHPGLKIFHLGNAYALNPSLVQMQKNSSIRAGLSVIAPDVSLLNRAELLLGASVLPSVKYILSNHKSSISSALKYFPHSRVGGYTVFGIVEPFAGYGGLEPFDRMFWQKKIVSPEFKGTRPILLYSGSKATLTKIVSSKIFDAVISANDWPLDKEFGDEERRDERRLVALRTNTNEVLKTPLGGQGVIRSPELQLTAPPEPLSVALSAAVSPKKTCLMGPGLAADPSCAGSQSTASKLLSRRLVTWLGRDQETGVSSEMKDVVAKARSAGNEQMKQLVSERTEGLKTTPFVGSEACQTCHADAYKKWQQTKHAHAYSTIKKASRDNDPECVSCHVLGFSAKGGFVSESLSPQFANVQCESCHGPRRDHAANPSIKIPHDAKQTCAECHTPPHSPKYNFKGYWKAIEHR